MNSGEHSKAHELGKSLTLLIDAGNTRIKWACVVAEPEIGNVGDWLAIGSISHSEIETLSALLAGFAARDCLISNVAGTGVQAALERILSTIFPQIIVRKFSACEHCSGLQNNYDNPLQLGSDRFASAIAAHRLFPNQALVVATCGTATTVDAVSEVGVFVGGMILPGLQVMAHALSANTAALPQVAEDLQLPTLFATNTAHAIISGCIHAQVGAIQCALAEVSSRAGTPARLIISGGAATYLLPHLEKNPTAIEWKIQHIENLVLMGLHIAAISANERLAAI